MAKEKTNTPNDSTRTFFCNWFNPFYSVDFFVEGKICVIVSLVQICDKMSWYSIQIFVIFHLNHRHILIICSAGWHLLKPSLHTGKRYFLTVAVSFQARNVLVLRVIIRRKCVVIWTPMRSKRSPTPSHLRAILWENISIIREKVLHR